MTQNLTDIPGTHVFRTFKCEWIKALFRSGVPEAVICQVAGISSLHAYRDIQAPRMSIMSFAPQVYAAHPSWSQGDRAW
ncbi:hypothetical protein [Corynebacterium ulcerans]|uniref:hypothetical protein n=1 Tax=Corynebacterium ulcerans TaxID=65058 RepID=UPI000BA3D027|nr:hypothetical protein [Corynebacterium ulcerans]QQU25153.1 hypothetical protein I6I75_07695 [Corynebacterium ulcerans]